MGTYVLCGSLGRAKRAPADTYSATLFRLLKLQGLVQGEEGAAAVQPPAQRGADFPQHPAGDAASDDREAEWADAVQAAASPAADAAGATECASAWWRHRSHTEAPTCFEQVSV